MNLIYREIFSSLQHHLYQSLSSALLKLVCPSPTWRVAQCKLITTTTMITTATSNLCQASKIHKSAKLAGNLRKIKKKVRVKLQSQQSKASGLTLLANLLLLLWWFLLLLLSYDPLTADEIKHSAWSRRDKRARRTAKATTQIPHIAAPWMGMGEGVGLGPSISYW